MPIELWKEIQYVSGGFTLCAFIIAAIAWAYQHKNQAEIDEIKAASENERAKLIARKLEFFDVDTSRLSREQQYNIAIKQIGSRKERFRLLATVVVLLAMLAAGLTAYAYRITADHVELRNRAADYYNDPAQSDKFKQIAAKINESITGDDNSADPTGINTGCPIGSRSDFSIVNGKMHYYLCAHSCFATRDSIALSDIDFEKMTTLTIPTNPNWSWVRVPCLAGKGKCVDDVMGTVGPGTTGCSKQMQQHDWKDEISIVSRTTNAQTVLDYVKDLAAPH